MQQRRNSGAFSIGEHYVFLALTHQNICHGTRSRVYHTLTTVDDLVPQGANASADILHTTFSLIFFQPRYWQYLIVLDFSWFFVHVVYFPKHDEKYNNEKIRIAQPRRPGFKYWNPVIERNIFRLNKALSEMLPVRIATGEIRAYLPVSSDEGMAAGSGTSLTLSFADGAAEVLQVQVQILYSLIYMSRRASRFMQ